MPPNNAELVGLTILTLLCSVPPTKAELVGYGGGAQLIVQDGADVELTCRVHDAKPKPDIIWYLGGVEISQGKLALFYTAVIGIESLMDHLYTFVFKGKYFNSAR